MRVCLLRKVIFPRKLCKIPHDPVNIKPDILLSDRFILPKVSDVASNKLATDFHHDIFHVYLHLFSCPIPDKSRRNIRCANDTSSNVLPISKFPFVLAWIRSTERERGDKKIDKEEESLTLK